MFMGLCRLMWDYLGFYMVILGVYIYIYMYGVM